MIQWRIEKDVKIDRLTLWNRRNSGKIYCRIVLLRIGFQQTRSGEMVTHITMICIALHG